MRFDDWLIKTNTGNADFGARAKWSTETTRRYRLGLREPDHEAMALIFELTGGAVTPNDWVGVGPRNDHEIEGAAS